MGIAKYFQRKARSAGKLVRMDRLRRSLRESFRRKKEHVPECSKPHQWQADEAAVRAGTCSFSVKYLGCVEVFESRGMQVCEEALKVLRNSRRRPVKGVLYVTGDGLRVVEDETKGLIVDQTIEKVSFCAPDRNHDKGFSYICRDGTTRRWMCHGFLAVRDSGERLSHAVGCAFAACLERKQKRDKECGVTMTFDPTNSSFTRTGSFRQTSLTERMQDPQECKPAEPPPVKPIHNPFAIERPHATPMMLQRQGSFRGFSQLGQSSPFKRQLSLRLNDLPSTLERQRSLSLESSDFSRQNGPVSPILESSPVVDKDTISAMCQQVSQGLSLLSSTDDPFVRTSQSQPQFPPSGSQQNTNLAFQPNGPQPASQPFIQSNPQSNPAFVSGTQTFNHSHPFQSTSQTFGGGLQQQQQQPTFPLPPGGTNQAFTTSTCQTTFSTQTINQAVSSKSFVNMEPIHQTNPWSASMGISDSTGGGEGSGGEITTSAAEAWLASTTGTAIPKSSSNPSDLFSSQFNGALSSTGPSQVIRRAPHLAHLRSQSLGEAPASSRTEPWTNGTSTDPFDAEWAALATRPPQPSTNPFQQSSIKAFEVQL